MKSFIFFSICTIGLFGFSETTDIGEDPNASLESRRPNPYLKPSLDLEKSVAAKSIRIDKSNVLKKILEDYKNRPELFIGSDAGDGMIDKQANIRSDLVISDLIDQISLLLYSKKFKKTLYPLWEKLIGDKPVENFPKAYAWFRKQVAVKRNKALRKKAKKLIVQAYSGAGIALYDGQDKKNSLVTRILRFRKKQKYNLLARDADARTLLHNLQGKAGKPFLSKRVNISQMKGISSKEISRVKSSHFKSQARAIESQNKRDGNSAKIKFVLKKNKGQVRIKARWGASKLTRRTTVPLFNALQSHPSRDQIFNYLRMSTGGKLDIPIIGEGENRHAVLTPSQVETHHEIISEALKDYTFNQLLANGDDQYLTHIRGWIKNNTRELTAKGIQVPSGNKKPSRKQAIALMADMEKVYPHHPWYQNFVLKDKNGKKIRPGESRGRRLFNGFKNFGKALANPRNLSILGTTIILSKLATPIVGTAVGSLLKDATYAKYVDRNIKDYMRSNSARNLTKAVVLGAGFGQGATARRIFIGGVEGALVAKASGKDALTGAAVGAGLEVVMMNLPPSIDNSLVKGIDKDLENRALELVTTGIHRGTQVAIQSYLEGSDTLAGFKTGAKVGAAEAALRIVFIGTKYDALGTSGLTPEEFAAEQIEHNKKMIALGNRPDKPVSYSTAERTVFRKFNWGGNRSINLPGNEIAMAPGDIADAKEVSHEMSHVSQKLRDGELGFHIKYFYKKYTSAINPYEDYPPSRY